MSAPASKQVNHTQGPWEMASNVLDGRRCVVIMAPRTGYVVAQTPTDDSFSRRDARLISAAPDMLRMLKLIVAPFDGAKAAGMPLGEAKITHDSRMLEMIREAIAKAEGV